LSGYIIDFGCIALAKANGFTDLREIWQQRYNEPYNSPIIQGAKFRVDEF